MTGGFPAPIVVARSRMRRLSLEKIAEQTERTFKKRNPSRAEDARFYLHNQLEPIFEGLSAQEKSCLLQCSQFRNGFDYVTAQNVLSFADPKKIDGSELESALEQLEWAELIHCIDTVGTEGGPRYKFYLPIEEWAESKWADRNVVTEMESRRFNHRFIDYFCGLFEHYNDPAQARNRATGDGLDISARTCSSAICAHVHNKTPPEQSAFCAQ